MPAKRTPPPLLHPSLLKHAEERANSIQDRVADAITAFAGSMLFVYIHVVVFAYWIVFKGQPFIDDPFPFGFLTMVVSLEAIFLSTFVMISQNRADLLRQALANHEWELTQQEFEQNKLLIDLQQQVLELTKELHRLTTEVHAAVHQGGDSASS